MEWNFLDKILFHSEYASSQMNFSMLFFSYIFGSNRLKGIRYVSNENQISRVLGPELNIDLNFSCLAGGHISISNITFSWYYIKCDILIISCTSRTNI